MVWPHENQSSTVIVVMLRLHCPAQKYDWGKPAATSEVRAPLCRMRRAHVASELCEPPASTGNTASTRSSLCQAR